MVSDMVMEAMVLDTEDTATVVTMAREMLMLRLRLVIIMDTVDMDMVTEAMDMDTMVIIMAREQLMPVIMVATEATDIMDIMVTEATDMDTMDKSKVSFIQTVLSSES